MMKHIIYKPLEQETIKDILAIEQACFSTPWSSESFSSSLQSGRNHFIVGYEKEKAVGFVGMQSIQETGEIIKVAVHPEHQRLGIAESLLLEMIAYCGKAEVEILFLEVRESNLPAISLYTKLGFAPVGQRKKYYTEPAEDALLMKKKL